MIRYRFYKWVHAVDPVTFEAKKARAYHSGETATMFGFEYAKLTVIGAWQPLEDSPK